MSKIYIVTSGNYSDYSIRSVFSTEEKAQAYVNVLEHYEVIDFSIEEHDVDEEAFELRDGYEQYRVWMRRDGDASAILVPPYKQEIGLRLHESPRGTFTLYGIVWAKSEQHAVKIANEQRSALIASNQWSTREDS